MAEFLKCDAAGCDHVEDVAAITEDMIDRPCPKCGASLLTRDDWDMWVSVFQPAIRAMKDEGLLQPWDPSTPRENMFKVNYHDGQVMVTSPFKPNPPTEV